MSRAQLTSMTADNVVQETLNNGSTTVKGGSVAPFVAGKNKIINGDFSVWQRGTSFSTASSTLSNGTYTADRWAVTYDGSGSTRTVSQQAFTPGTAPVAGYESAYYWQYAQTVAGSGATYNDFYQRIEDVRTFAGQTVTVSFWAKVSSGTIGQSFALRQYYGNGGSVIDTNSAGWTVTTNWQRFSLTVTLPSLSGATLGSGSWLALEFRLPTNTTFTYSLWGLQVEAGSVATPFTTCSNTLQGELALAQRYYYRVFPNASASTLCPSLYCGSSTLAYGTLQFPTQMRIMPTALEQTGTASDYVVYASIGGTTCSAVPTFYDANYNSAIIKFTVASGLNTGYSGYARTGSTAGYLGWSAEL
jgi:hypothetical protein